MTDAIIPVANFARLAGERFEPLRRVLCQHASMRLALKWFFSTQPPLAPEDLIAQDEFSYDLLVPYSGSLYLSYDTT